MLNGIRAISSQRFYFSQQSQLLCGRLRSTVPRFVQVRDGGTRNEWRRRALSDRVRPCVREIPHLAKQLAARQRNFHADQLGQVRLERVDRRLAVNPRIGERTRIESA